MATSFASLPKERPNTKCFWRLVYSVLAWMHFRYFAGGAKCGRGWSEHGDSVPLLPWKPGVFSFYCLPLLPWKPGVFSFYCLPLLPCEPDVFSFYCLPLLPWKPGVFRFLLSTTSALKTRCVQNQVCSVVTVCHFYLENQVCSKLWLIFTDVYHLHLENQDGCVFFHTVSLTLTYAVQVLLCGPSRMELRCTQPHSTLDTDPCCAGITVWAIRGWVEMYSVTQYSWFWLMPCRYRCACHQRVELRCTQCTQSHSTSDADLCCAGIAVHAIRGWNWGVLSHAVPVMLTYVVQLSLCMPSEGGIEVYSVMQYQWCWLMLCRYCCACHQRVELRCT